LVEKGLLTRTMQGRSYVYRPAMSREEFFAWVSGRIVRDLIADFGDVAIAQFLQAIESVDPARLQALRRLASEQE
jgi:predicted transcriptional regulator